MSAKSTTKKVAPKKNNKTDMSDADFDLNNFLEDDEDLIPGDKKEKKSTTRTKTKRAEPSSVCSVRLPDSLISELESSGIDISKTFKEFLETKVLKERKCPTCGQKIKNH